MFRYGIPDLIKIYIFIKIYIRPSANLVEEDINGIVPIIALAIRIERT